MKIISHTALAAIMVGTSALFGCAHEQAVQPTRAPVGFTETTSSVVPARAAPQDLHVSDDVLKACQIDFDNVSTAPKFDFDSSDLQPGERTLLEQVATCVTTGPLKGRSLRLIGRADPRGEAEYNFVLGASRANGVRSYLTGLGLDSSRIATTSRGKLDATGSDDASWRLDRRVDIDLQ